ncbi:TELO2-interacting protein 2-like [Harpegnathos saltator]|uniref:TELO2-interacting protein 2-like n=1 Tax=Harpegnathos saltator TaxID=610380 RepID=UPI00058ED75A|nr:TELO2-interacting protein 2-like [Harpegnathos saltator]XP_011146963.1 TELO2-interacting protein 2-like [Harpegnathos saltator]XP_011146964.1 TELO2-interacting protein 2-like [Harpegnathos saltator]XP_011146965.1 TELO2-interacting protein 2-like [Harpegnathos saltator]
MDDLLKELETLRISGNFSDHNWKSCIDLIQTSHVPQKMIGETRPCEEKDFREYRLIVERNLSNVRFMLRHIVDSCREKHLLLIDDNVALAKMFGMNLLLLIGEHIEKNIWNTAECVNISKELIANFCELWACQSITAFFSEHENFNKLLVMLRPKLLKDTWKTYPAAVTCFKWMLHLVEKPMLFNYISQVLPTTLILLDDHVPENISIGLQCLHLIIQHSHMKKGLIDSGYALVIYHSLKHLTYRKQVEYIIPLYTCLANIIPTIEYWNDRSDAFEWTVRDEILSNLIDNMTFEQNIELRHAYMVSLPQFLTNIGCGKWCESLARILVEYCEHHTDLRTLKATLQTAKTFLLMFHLRITAHCVSLYTAFLKLHFDLTETPVFDREIMQNLQDCICLLYDRSQNVGHAVLNDDRIRPIFSCTMPFGCRGDITYFE